MKNKQNNTIKYRIKHNYIYVIIRFLLSSTFKRLGGCAGQGVSVKTSCNEFCATNFKLQNSILHSIIIFISVDQ